MSLNIFIKFVTLCIILAGLIGFLFFYLNVTKTQTELCRAVVDLKWRVNELEDANWWVQESIDRIEDSLGIGVSLPLEVFGDSILRKTNED